MTNSFFNFEEAPDYASQIGSTYTSLNASFDRAEALERENDRTREINAAMPLKMLKGLIEFSPKAAKMYEGVAEKRRDFLREQGYEGIGQEYIDADKKTLEEILKVDAAENYVRDAALKDGDNITFETMSMSGPHQARRRLLMLDELRRRMKSGFSAHMQENYPAGFKKPEEYDAAFRKYKSQILKNADDIGFSSRFVKGQLEKDFDTLQTNFYKTENDKLTAQNQSIVLGTQIKQVESALEKEDAVAAFINISESNIAYYDGNRAKALRAMINIGLMGVEKGGMNLDQLEAVVYGQIEAKGDRAKALIDKLGGGPESRIWAESVISKIDELRSAKLDNIDQSKKDERRKFVNEIDAYEAENGRMEKAEYAAYVMSKWDIGKMGGNLPENIKNRLSKEGADDFLQKAVLDGRLNKGLGITQEEVDKLQDAETRKTYSALVETGNEKKPSKEFADIAEGFIKTYANTRTSETDGNKEKSERWNSIYTQAPKWYGIYYEEEIATASSAAQAHLNALKRVKDNIINGDFDVLPNVDEQSNLTRRVNLIKAERHIKTIDPNIINTGIIYGTEDIVKEAAKLPKGETHLFYQQLADKLPGIHADDLQFKQLELAHKEFGTDKPVKSDIQLALEKLPESVREKLTFHPSPARVARAKIEAYGSDNDITYNEIEFLLDEVSDFYTTPEGQAILDAQFPVEDEVVIKPDRNIVSAGNRTRQRPIGEVPFIETEQFKNVMSTLGSFLPELGFGKETRDALTQDIATAIEKRRKEVEEQNRQPRR